MTAALIQAFLIWLSTSQIDFDIFASKNLIAWQKQMEQFYHEVSEIEAEAKVFINQSFKKLRSAEGAFDMLVRFRNIRSREAINTEMMKKFSDILTQYARECDLVRELFEANRQAPPLYKNHPPVAGAISWSRFLFRTIKTPMVKFLNVSILMNSEQGKEVSIHISL